VSILTILRCAAKASNGRQCQAVENLDYRNYHGDSEIYGWDGPEPGWVLVWLCPKHRRPRKHAERAK